LGANESGVTFAARLKKGLEKRGGRDR